MGVPVLQVLQPAPCAGRSPLLNVSVVVLTCNRRAYLPLVIGQVSVQERVSAEVVIVDDGPEPALAEVRRLQRVHTLPIRYFLLPSGQSIGSKREFGVRQARGEFIAHWDDDDLYSTDRLWRQLAPMARGEADVTYLRNSFIMTVEEGRTDDHPAAGARWDDQPSQSTRTSVYWLANRPEKLTPFFGSLVYPRGLALQIKRPFANSSVSEDVNFVFRAMDRCARVAPVYEPFSMYVRHIAVGASQQSRSTWKWQIQPCAQLGGRWAQDTYVARPKHPHLQAMCRRGAIPCDGKLMQAKRMVAHGVSEPSTLRRSKRRTGVCGRGESR